MTHVSTDSEKPGFLMEAYNNTLNRWLAPAVQPPSRSVNATSTSKDSTTTTRQPYLQPGALPGSTAARDPALSATLPPHGISTPTVGDDLLRARTSNPHALAMLHLSSVPSGAAELTARLGASPLLPTLRDPAATVAASFCPTLTAPSEEASHTSRTIDLRTAVHHLTPAVQPNLAAPLQLPGGLPPSAEPRHLIMFRIPVAAAIEGHATLAQKGAFLAAPPSSTDSLARAGIFTWTGDHS